jgi:hypothetical protein
VRGKLLEVPDRYVIKYIYTVHFLPVLTIAFVCHSLRIQARKRKLHARALR